MVCDRFRVVTVKGHPEEQFMMIWLDTSFPANGPFMRTSDGLAESELRTALTHMGCSEPEIDDHVQFARENPC